MAVVSISNVKRSGATSVLTRTRALQTRTVIVIAARTTNAKSRVGLVSISHFLLSTWKIFWTNALPPMIVIHPPKVAV